MGDKNAKKTAVLFVDIETSGAFHTKNEIISIGWAYKVDDGKRDCKNAVKGKINFEFDMKKMEKRCWDGFWSKFPDILESLKKDAMSAEKGIEKFTEMVDDLEDKYDLHIWTDNPTFDIAWINHYLDVYLNRLPLNYEKKTGKYRPINDVTSFYRGFERVKSDVEWISSNEIAAKYGVVPTATHDHSPDNDALNMLEKYIGVVNQ